MVVGGTALFGGGRGNAAQSKAVVEFRAGKMTTQTGKRQLTFITRIGQGCNFSMIPESS